jgi:glycosyltransferase involved in cell wall biosynthesis
VNLKGFKPLRSPAADSLSDPPLILSVGRLVEKKGFEDLLRALLIVKEQGGHFRCAIYGDGPLHEHLSSWIEQHGLTNEIALKGSRIQEQLIPVFQGAALFVLTPYQTDDGDRDGIPNTLLEAMAVGLPIITTSAGGIHELVENNRDGLLYQPHDVEGIASGITELLRNPHKRSQLGSAASRKVVEQFDITQAARSLRALFAQADAFSLSTSAESGRSTSTSVS